MSTEPEIVPEFLTEWRERMGYSARRSVIELGCSREGFAMWERGDTKIPRYIALACVALEHGLTPKSNPLRKKGKKK